MDSAEQGTRTAGAAEGNTQKLRYGVLYVAEGWAAHMHVELPKAHQSYRVEALED